VKLLWVSNAPFAATGYGQQTALFVPRIASLGYDIAISAYYGVEGAMVDWRGFRLYPSDHTHYGRAMTPKYAEHWAEGEECLVLTLMDVWVLKHGWEQLKVGSWAPVDHHPIPPRVYEYFARSGARPIAMSRFGEEEMRNAELDPLYVPHGVDTERFKRWSDADREGIREALKIPKDAFVVGMVANNKGQAPPRKAFPQVFQAFAEFRKQHDDAFLYLHSEMFGVEQGINLLALAQICDIPESAYGATDQFTYHLGISDEQLSALYTSFDVLASPSYGEGFGIPILEAQACGVPVIVTDWTSMTELCGAGWLVQGDPWYDPHHGAFYKCPSVAEIYDAMMEAYDKAEGMQLKARSFALQYDADLVLSEHWVPVLKELEGPREIAPLRQAEAVGA
jgi:glycosyltransferase involved in cell wall biosynthesis